MESGSDESNLAPPIVRGGMIVNNKSNMNFVYGRLYLFDIKIFTQTSEDQHSHKNQYNGILNDHTHNVVK